MSFLKDHINKLKSGGFGKEKWTKRGDIEKQEQEERQNEYEEMERKRKQKELEKLRTLSYQASREQHIYRREEEGTEEVPPPEATSTLEKEAKELAEIEREKRRQLKRQKLGETEEAKQPSQEPTSEVEETKIDAEKLLKIKNTLRKSKHPIKLFGESDYQAYVRLCNIAKDDKSDIMKKADQTLFNYNERHTNLTDFQRSLKEKLKDKKPIDLPIGDKKVDDLVETRQTKHSSYPDFKKFEKECKSIGVKEKCETVLKWLKKMMRLWEEDFINRDPELMKTPGSKFEVNNYMQTKKDIKPVYKLLYKQKLNHEILDTLYLLVRYSMMMEYVKANDKYYDLGIGNAPWPIGVTQVGIHERSGRSKIYSSQVSHIMNDETQKKYIICIKRLLSTCQKHYPTDPSKNVTM